MMTKTRRRSTPKKKKMKRRRRKTPSSTSTPSTMAPPSTMATPEPWMREQSHSPIYAPPKLLLDMTPQRNSSSPSAFASTSVSTSASPSTSIIARSAHAASIATSASVKSTPSRRPHRPNRPSDRTKRALAQAKARNRRDAQIRKLESRVLTQVVVQQATALAQKKKEEQARAAAALKASLDPNKRWKPTERWNARKIPKSAARNQPVGSSPREQEYQQNVAMAAVRVADYQRQQMFEDSSLALESETSDYNRARELRAHRAAEIQSWQQAKRTFNRPQTSVQPHHHHHEGREENGYDPLLGSLTSLAGLAGQPGNGDSPGLEAGTAGREAQTPGSASHTKYDPSHGEDRIVSVGMRRQRKVASRLERLLSLRMTRPELEARNIIRQTQEESALSRGRSQDASTIRLDHTKRLLPSLLERRPSIDILRMQGVLDPVHSTSEFTKFKNMLAGIERLRDASTQEDLEALAAATPKTAAEGLGDDDVADGSLSPLSTSMFPGPGTPRRASPLAPDSRAEELLGGGGGGGGGSPGSPGSPAVGDGGGTAAQGGSGASGASGSGASRALAVVSPMDEYESDLGPEWRPDQEFWRVLHTEDPLYFTAKKRVAGGTVNRLVEFLTLDGRVSDMFTRVFFLTYKCFMTKAELVGKLLARYADIPLDGSLDVRAIRMRVCYVLTFWVEEFPFDFGGVPRVVSVLQDFASVRLVDDGFLSQSSQLLVSLDRAGYVRSARREAEARARERLYPSDMLAKYRRRDILSIDAEDVAKQMSLISFQLFGFIQPAELIRVVWTKKSTVARAANVMRMIARFNEISSWIQFEILKREKVKERAAVVQKFIQVAHELLKLNNFDNLMAIVAAINSAPILRLAATHGLVKSKYRSRLAAVEDVMSSRLNHTKYRSILFSIPRSTPALPYLGMFLQDLYFIQDGNPDVYKKKPGIVNFTKHHQTASMILQVQRFQRVPYVFSEVSWIKAVVTQVCDLDDEGLYQLSLRREPRR